MSLTIAKLSVMLGRYSSQPREVMHHLMTKHVEKRESFAADLSYFRTQPAFISDTATNINEKTLKGWETAIFYKVGYFLNLIEAVLFLFTAFSI